MADDALIRQVKEANDIVHVVGSYVALRPVGATWKGLCPFHDDHRPSFDVDPRRQRYRCWSCNKSGDVISFVQEHERITFPEALELLARRAGIPLENQGASPQAQGRALMLETIRWAAEQFQRCLLDDALAEQARQYLGERRLLGETVRRFGLGFAPPAGDWLVQRGRADGVGFDLLEEVGLLARRMQGNGHYCRFRDRVMFPIRDALGRTVGFGGRILPTSPELPRAPKYYNSAETPLFNKSEQLYGLDAAKAAAGKAGYLAVVEGYTDVLMAHQMGVSQVVATMGTALNARHVHKLRLFAPRVVLVFDADAGGDTGVDRALEIFAGQEVDLAVATLPDGLDPCDLLVTRGVDPFRQALETAADALDFKLRQVTADGAAEGVEGRRRAADAVLAIIALAPELAGQSGAMKRELMVTRIAQRLGLRETTVRARLDELRQRRQRAEEKRRDPEPAGERRSPPPAPHERQLLEVLLADPGLVPAALAEVGVEEIAHLGLRQLLAGLYALQAEGEPPTLDLLRARLDNPRLAAAALEFQEIGRANPNRDATLRQLLAEFRRRRLQPVKQELQNQLNAVSDHAQAVELLRRLQAETH
ncbi:MAG TPA: DNA primase [Gemmataceae bacterium]|nr:DNA primase [Gemmataceae bacterium]